MALCNPRDLINAHQLECWTCGLTLVMQSIATMSLKHVTLLSAHVINGEYVERYTSLIQKVILLCNVLRGVSLVAKAILLRYVTRYISNALLLTVK